MWMKLEEIAPTMSNEHTLHYKLSAYEHVSFKFLANVGKNTKRDCIRLRWHFLSEPMTDVK